MLLKLIGLYKTLYKDRLKFVQLDAMKSTQKQVRMLRQEKLRFEGCLPVTPFTGIMAKNWATRSTRPTPWWKVPLLRKASLLLRESSVKN